MIRIARKIHRVLSYIIFLQVAFWVLGGVIFAVLPLDSVVKGGSVVIPPAAQPFPEGWLERITPLLDEGGEVTGLKAASSSQGPLLEITEGTQSRWVRLSDGRPAESPDIASISSYAVSLYTGDGTLSSTRLLAVPERRYLGLVDELYGRENVWQVSFDDRLSTRLYFDGDTGRYLTVRNEAWVLYDAMWRLHIMDYQNGEDFNNPLLLVAAILALLFTVSGLVLTWNSASGALARR